MKFIRNITKEYTPFSDESGENIKKFKVIKYKVPWAFNTTQRSVNFSRKERTKLELRQNVQDFVDERNLRRSKTTIKDIALCNYLPLMVTFTFNPKIVKRQDPTCCKIALSKWLQHMRRKYGPMEYVFVPEQHRDGSLHFHGLIGGYKGTLQEKPFDRNGRPQYELPDYKYGFTQAQIIKHTQEDYDRSVSYITKYVTKDMLTFAGKKRFWCSKGLKRPIKKINDARFDDISKEDITTYNSKNSYIVRHAQCSEVLGFFSFTVLYNSHFIIFFD